MRVEQVTAEDLLHHEEFLRQRRESPRELARQVEYVRAFLRRFGVTHEETVTIHAPCTVSLSGENPIGPEF